MKSIATVFAVAITLAAPLSPSFAGYNFKLSTSPTDHAAGSSLVLNGIGDTGSLYVWASTDPTGVLAAISLDFVASNPAVVSADSHLTENPFLARWFSADEGTLNAAPNFLVKNTNAVGVIFPGIQTAGNDDFALHSTLTVTSTAIGTSEITLQEGDSDISYLGDPLGSSFSGATITAVPEPSGITALIGGALCFTLRRRRKIG